MKLTRDHNHNFELFFFILFKLVRIQTVINKLRQVLIPDFLILDFVDSVVVLIH